MTLAMVLFRPVDGAGAVELVALSLRVPTRLDLFLLLGVVSTELAAFLLTPLLLLDAAPPLVPSDTPTTGLAARLLFRLLVTPAEELAALPFRPSTASPLVELATLDERAPLEAALPPRPRKPKRPYPS